MMKPSGEPIITIITVSLNNSEGLEKTIKSVISQEYTDYELIVIDGGSRDGSLDIIDKYRQSISEWVSEPDKGPYDAMNKGAKMAKGNWIIFLNSGDMFYEPASLKKMMQYIPDHNHDAIYGDNLVDYHDFLVYRKASPYKEIWRGMIFSHQALLLKTSLITANPFDLRLSKIADYDQVLRCLKDPERVYYAPVPFVICDAFGISAKGQAGIIRAYYRCSRRFHSMSAGRKLYFIRRYILSLVIDIAKFFIPAKIYYRITGLLKKKHAFPGK